MHDAAQNDPKTEKYFILIKMLSLYVQQNIMQQNKFKNIIKISIKKDLFTKKKKPLL